MFLNQKILSKLMKEACKGGLTVARKEDWIHLAGRGWKTTIKESHMPNKTKGDIVALLGKLPTSGECYTVTTKEKEEFCWPQVEGEMEKLHVTRVILDGLLSEMQRVLQFEDGKIVTVNNMFVDIVDNTSIDEKTWNTVQTARLMPGQRCIGKITCAYSGHRNVWFAKIMRRTYIS